MVGMVLVVVLFVFFILLHWFLCEEAMGLEFFIPTRTKIAVKCKAVKWPSYIKSLNNYVVLSCRNPEKSCDFFFYILERNCDSAPAGKLPGVLPGNQHVWNSVKNYVGIQIIVRAGHCTGQRGATVNNKDGHHLVPPPIKSPHCLPLKV